MSGPYAGHTQTKAPAQPAPFTQQTAIPNEGRDMRGAPDQRQQQPGDQQHTTKPFAPQQSTSILGDGGDGRSPPQNANRPPAESSPPQVFTSQKAPGYAAAAGGVSK